MNVCYFGSYEPTYSRNTIICKGLESNKFKIYHCQASGIFLIRYFKLLRLFMKCQKNIAYILVGFPGHYDLLPAFFLSKLFGKKLYFDIFAPLYETYVSDRKIITPKSIKAIFYYLVDFINLHLSDYVIADTKTHLKYFCRFYKINPNKGIIIYIGADDKTFHPTKDKNTQDVLFYGSYQPLQGVDNIIRAASLLLNVKFKLIGNGQTRRSNENLSKRLKLNNVQFQDWTDQMSIAREIHRSKIILGIFGKTIKTRNVIPNKVYEGLASQKAVITTDTPACRELLSNKQCLLIKNDSEQIAGAIIRLMKNRKLRVKLSEEGCNLYMSKLTPKLIVQGLINHLLL